MGQTEMQPKIPKTWDDIYNLARKNGYGHSHAALLADKWLKLRPRKKMTKLLAWQEREQEREQETA